MPPKALLILALSSGLRKAAELEVVCTIHEPTDCVYGLIRGRVVVSMAQIKPTDSQNSCLQKMSLCEGEEMSHDSQASCSKSQTEAPEGENKSAGFICPKKKLKETIICDYLQGTCFGEIGCLNNTTR